jgi:leader peptidase (prepilin peptidase)/N-methyltransferase
LACLFAPFVGSFLGVVVTRHDRPGALLVGRSACDSCGTRLGFADLVPVLSWLCSRGKCRHCRASISLFYPAMELAALAIALWSGLLFSGALLWASCFLGWALLALAATDLRYFILPDFVTWPLMAAGLLVHLFLDPDAISGYLIGAATGYAFVRLLRFAYRRWRGREGMGLGDAKLLAAAGAWISWQGLPSVLLIASLSGLTVVLLRSWWTRKLDPGQAVAFGVFLAAGLWIVWLYGPLTLG